MVRETYADQVARVREYCMEESGGDVDDALTIAAERYVRAVGKQSLGFIYAKGIYKSQLPPKPRPAEPVVLESERDAV